MRKLGVVALLISFALFALPNLNGAYNLSTGPMGFTGNQLAEWNVDIDFGTAAHTEPITISCTFTTNAGFAVELYDITRAARATNVTAWNAGMPLWSTGVPTTLAPGTYALQIGNADYQTLSLTGVHRFIFAITPGDANGTFPNNVTLNVSNGANTGTAVAGFHQWTTRPVGGGLGMLGSSEFFQRNYFGNALLITNIGAAADTIQYEFDVNFGATPVQKAMSIWAFTFSTSTGVGNLDFEIFVLGDGYENPPEATMSVSPNVENVATYTTPPLQGQQKIRVVVSAGAGFTATHETLAFFTVESGVVFGEALVQPVAESPRMAISPTGTTVSTTTPLSATGGTPTASYQWAIQGTPPAGVSVSPTTGANVDLVITGTPPTTVVTVRCTNATKPEEFTEETYTITGVAAPLTISGPPSLPNGIATANYGPINCTATGGTPPYSWAATGLPGGVTIDPGTGVISGAPTAAGTFNTIVVTVTDSAAPTGSDNQNYSMTVAPGVNITTTTLPNGTVGVLYTGGDITAANGTPNFNWGSTGNLPTGLTLDQPTTNTTSISGTPTQAGTFNFTVNVLESGGSTDSQAFSVTIDPAVSITTTTLPGGVVNSTYNQNIDAAGGAAPYAWTLSLGTLPPGLSLGTSTTNQVAISGTPTQTGDFQFTVQVQEDGGQTATQQYTVTIANAGGPGPGTGTSGSTGGTCSAGQGAGLWVLFLMVLGAAAVIRRRMA